MSVPNEATASNDVRVAIVGVGNCASSLVQGVQYYLDADEQIGVQIVKRALSAPIKTIADNAGFEGSVVVEKVKGLPAGEGLNAATGEYGDLLKMGVIDPVKVTRSALQNAASIASLILITEATVSDIPVDDGGAAAAMGGMGGMGGMM